MPHPSTTSIFFLPVRNRSYSNHWQNLNLIHVSSFLTNFIAHYVTFKEGDFLFYEFFFNDLWYVFPVIQ